MILGQNKLSDDQIHEMAEMFPNIPDPNHHPRGFYHYVKLYLWIKKDSKSIDIRV